MDSNDIKNVIADMLRHMQIAVDAIELSESDGRECFAVRTPDSQLLIGVNGVNLHAFNHLVKKIASAKGGRPPASLSQAGQAAEKQFFVDVNGYQEAAVENLKQLAKVMGDRARSFKSSVELDPMSSYERMVIHSFFQEAKDLKTESTGEGERRRVVVKYVEQNSE
ncbi:MAG: R3H domain-containing nucleic acid-binding protein [bacterium]|nr:R3H domain-containing nucleic acid-binding protein [bacterium]